jgi:hypothetical protein
MSKRVEIVGSGCEGKFAEIAKKAERGKASLDEIRELLDSMPNISKQLGSVAKQAEWSWVTTFSGGNELVAEATRRELRDKKKKLLGSDPSPLECSLVHRIVLCQFQLDYIDTVIASKTREGMSAGAVAMYQQWLDRAQSRYLSAVKALAVIRKLALPVVQLNVGEQQVNVANMDITQGPPTKLIKNKTEHNKDNN